MGSERGRPRPTTGVFCQNLLQAVVLHAAGCPLRRAFGRGHAGDHAGRSSIPSGPACSQPRSPSSPLPRRSAAPYKRGKERRQQAAMSPGLMSPEPRAVYGMEAGRLGTQAALGAAVQRGARPASCASMADAAVREASTGRGAFASMMQRQPNRGRRADPVKQGRHSSCNGAAWSCRPATYRPQVAVQVKINLVLDPA